MSFVDDINTLTNASFLFILKGLCVPKSTYYEWIERKENNRLGDIPPVGIHPLRLLESEKDRIKKYYLSHQNIGYRRLTFMMIDENIVCTSASAVYRYLSSERLLIKPYETKVLGNPPPLPKYPNEKWHTDLMFLMINGYFYYYQAVIDAYSRYIIAWDIHLEGTALSTSMVLQDAFDRSPAGITPDIIADNGLEFLGKEFREVIKENNGNRIRITAYHPQSNGIDERHHRTLREECTNGEQFKNVIEAKEKVGKWVKFYNKERLHSAIDFMPPEIWHNGNKHKLREERIEKLALARANRMNINSRKAS